MEELLHALRKTEIFTEWQQRYRLEVFLKETEIMIEITPFPPDTYDSIREEMMDKEIKRMETELSEQKVPMRIDHEACSLFADTFCLYILPQDT